MLASFQPRRPGQRIPLYRKQVIVTQHTDQKRNRIRLVFLLIVSILLVRFWYKASYVSLEKQSDAPRAELQLAQNVQLKSPGARIPKIVHFVYGLRGPDPTLDLIHYIAIKAAHDTIKPDKIMFHYHYMPTGELFEKAKPMLTLRHVPLVEQVFGRPVSHYAHRADVVRLEALMEFGGIYFDLDLIALKPVDHLLENEFVMAQEGIDGAMGLCNAMIMARQNARFLQRWYATYQTFDSSDWNYHSVVLPGKLAPHYPDEVTVLDHKAYFWPLWDSVGLRTLFLEKSFDFNTSLGTHIWESPANKHLMRGVTPEVILNIDNSLYCRVRQFLLEGPDPRADACQILLNTEREDKLVGHWTLDLAGKPWMNPMRADDISGNNVNGIIQSGDAADGGVHVTGRDSYVFLSLPIETTLDELTVSWWMKTRSDKENGTAVVVQTDRAKIYVRTEKISIYRPKPNVQRLVPISLGLSTVLLEDDWTWTTQQAMEVHSNPFPINQDDDYHFYSLTINRRAHDNLPALSLSMDGYVINGLSTWNITEKYGSIIRGIWFGSSEPEHSNYQDPWDTDPSLEAVYKDIRVWERVLTPDELRQVMKEDQRAMGSSQAQETLDFANAVNIPGEDWISQDKAAAGTSDSIVEDDDSNTMWTEDDQQ